MLSNILSRLESNQTELSVTDIYGKTYILDNSKMFTIYALNILLVLEGKRLAYRVDIGQDKDKNQHYAKLAHDIDPRLTVYLPNSYEPYIILKENCSLVDDVFSKNEESIAAGKILGYSYNGPHWVGQSVCDLYYSISFYAVKNNEGHILYTFNIPSTYYNNDMKDDILDKKKSFDQCLSKEGYQVSINHICSSYNKFDFIDGLPNKIY